jgi:hypothetical protein
MGFFYWAAAEELARHGTSALLPELAEKFTSLDLNSYDPDALSHLEDYLLAGGFDAEALKLAEHFLEIERANDNLMPYAVPNRCELIYELRVGRTIVYGTGGEQAPEVAQQLIRGLEDEIDPDRARPASEILCGAAPKSAWVRADFRPVDGNVCEDPQAWQDCVRLLGNLIRVAQEGWQFDRQPPGSGLRGLSLVLNSVYNRREYQWEKSKKKLSDNLLSYLGPGGLDARITRASRDLIGVNEPRARLLLRAQESLTNFALRHGLISAAEAKAMGTELSRLRSYLDRFLDRSGA